MDDRKKLYIAIAAIGLVVLIVVGYLAFGKGKARPGQPVAGSGQSQPAPEEPQPPAGGEAPQTGGSREAPG
ncbi:MAG: hypothetical protein ACF8R7_08675 [Phycisphaerales bacterium JB039]